MKSAFDLLRELELSPDVTTTVKCHGGGSLRLKYGVLPSSPSIQDVIEAVQACSLVEVVASGKDPRKALGVKTASQKKEVSGTVAAQLLADHAEAVLPAE